MNITSSDVSSNYRKLYDSYQKPEVSKRIRSEIEDQKILEREILVKDHTACPSNVDPLEIASHLPELDASKLKLDISDKFYDASIMKAVSCIANSTFVENKTLQGITRGKEYIGSDPEIIGDESVYGLAMATSLGQTEKDAFILKAPRFANTPEELIHETCVAFYGTNKMRDLGIPNFAYVYGSFICNAPYVDSSNEVISYCTKEAGGVSYAIYENIAPGMTMEKYCFRCSPQEFMYAYLQLMMAEKIAHREIDFTHYDLHPKNVLLREGPGIFYVPFPASDGTKWYCKAFGRIPTMIDFGMSHIVTNDIDYGHVGISAPLFPHGVFRDRSFPLYDAYKLFMMCLNVMKFKGNMAYLQLAPLTRFFNKSQNADEIMNTQLKFYLFGLPYTQQTSALSDKEWEEYSNKYFPGEAVTFSSSYYTLEDWIDHCRLYCIDKGWEDPFVKIPNPQIPILGCNGSCVNTDPQATLQRTQSEIHDVLFQNSVHPKTFIDFYDVEGLFQQRIMSAQQEIEKDENPQIADLRKSLHIIKRDYNNYINTHGLNNKDPQLRTLYDNYLRLNGTFHNSNPNEEYMDRVRKYELLNDEYENILKDFHSNFNYIFNRENLKIKSIDLAPFPIVRISDIADVLDDSFFAQNQKFVTQVIQFMDNLKEVERYLFAMYKIFNLYKTWKDIKLDSFTELYLSTNQRSIDAQIFAQKLRASLSEDIRKVTSPSEEVQALKKLINRPTVLRNGKQINNPYKNRIWYFNTYSNLASFL